ncbi:unnamed protein product [Darwinula stevensoni]|uniref:Smoothelin domain-containing protein n=1 Tax=Darwinula stevensoni TaxID=69355 RepID=A0A7R8X181_9CRUS|nr:unnamed protein product [Darwinula stevensoni]CAG0881997.1 unnamed protein product [Darwinula stevensoni]
MADLEGVQDINRITDEDLLRRLCQKTKDFSEKKKIRARMSKLREQRLSEFYSSEAIESAGATERSEFHIETGERAASSPEPNIEVLMDVGSDGARTESITAHNVRIGGITMRAPGGGHITSMTTAGGEVTVSSNRSFSAEDIIQERIRQRSLERGRRLQEVMNRMNTGGDGDKVGTQEKVVIVDTNPLEGDETVVSITKSTYYMQSSALAGESFMSMKSREVADSASPQLGQRKVIGSYKAQSALEYHADSHSDDEDELAVEKKTESVKKTVRDEKTSVRKTAIGESAGTRKMSTERKTSATGIPSRKPSTGSVGRKNSDAEAKAKEKVKPETEKSPKRKASTDDEGSTSPGQRSPRRLSANGQRKRSETRYLEIVPGQTEKDWEEVQMADSEKNISSTLVIHSGSAQDTTTEEVPEVVTKTYHAETSQEQTEDQPAMKTSSTSTYTISHGPNELTKTSTSSTRKVYEYVHEEKMPSTTTVTTTRPLTQTWTRETHETVTGATEPLYHSTVEYLPAEIPSDSVHRTPSLGSQINDLAKSEATLSQDSEVEEIMSGRYETSRREKRVHTIRRIDQKTEEMATEKIEEYLEAPASGTRKDTSSAVVITEVKEKHATTDDRRPKSPESTPKRKTSDVTVPRGKTSPSQSDATPTGPKAKPERKSSLTKIRPVSPGKEKTDRPKSPRKTSSPTVDKSETKPKEESPEKPVEDKPEGKREQDKLEHRPEGMDILTVWTTYRLTTLDVVTYWQRREVTTDEIIILITGKFILIEDIEDMDLLDKMLDVSTESEVRRYIRTQIRKLRRRTKDTVTMEDSVKTSTDRRTLEEKTIRKTVEETTKRSESPGESKPTKAVEAEEKPRESAFRRPRSLATQPADEAPSRPRSFPKEIPSGRTSPGKSPSDNLVRKPSKSKLKVSPVEKAPTKPADAPEEVPTKPEEKPAGEKPSKPSQTESPGDLPEKVEEFPPYPGEQQPPEQVIRQPSTTELSIEEVTPIDAHPRAIQPIDIHPRAIKPVVLRPSETPEELKPHNVPAEASKPTEPEKQKPEEMKPSITETKSKPEEITPQKAEAKIPETTQKRRPSDKGMPKPEDTPKTTDKSAPAPSKPVEAPKDQPKRKTDTWIKPKDKPVDTATDKSKPTGPTKVSALLSRFEKPTEEAPEKAPQQRPSSKKVPKGVVPKVTETVTVPKEIPKEGTPSQMALQKAPERVSPSKTAPIEAPKEKKPSTETPRAVPQEKAPSMEAPRETPRDRVPLETTDKKVPQEKLPQKGTPKITSPEETPSHPDIRKPTEEKPEPTLTEKRVEKPAEESPRRVSRPSQPEDSVSPALLTAPQTTKPTEAKPEEVTAPVPHKSTKKVLSRFQEKLPEQEKPLKSSPVQKKPEKTQPSQDTPTEVSTKVLEISKPKPERNAPDKKQSVLSAPGKVSAIMEKFSAAKEAPAKSERPKAPSSTPVGTAKTRVEPMPIEETHEVTPREQAPDKEEIEKIPDRERPKELRSKPVKPETPKKAPEEALEIPKHVLKETPAAPKDTPAAPRDTPAAPRDTPAAPRDTPAAPRDTLDAPRDTPAAPRDTLDAPRDIPDAPRDTPDAPKDIPDAPRDTPDAPKDTSDAPHPDEEESEKSPTVMSLINRFETPQEQPEETRPRLPAGMDHEQPLEGPRIPEEEPYQKPEGMDVLEFWDTYEVNAHDIVAMYIYKELTIEEVMKLIVQKKIVVREIKDVPTLHKMLDVVKDNKLNQEIVQHLEVLVSPGKKPGPEGEAPAKAPEVPKKPVREKSTEKPVQEKSPEKSHGKPVKPKDTKGKQKVKTTKSSAPEEEEEIVVIWRTQKFSAKDLVGFWLTKQITIQEIVTLIRFRLVIIEEILDISILEEVLKVVREYDLTSRVRAQIRHLKRTGLKLVPADDIPKDTLTYTVQLVDGVEDVLTKPTSRTASPATRPTKSPTGKATKQEEKKTPRRPKTEDKRPEETKPGKRSEKPQAPGDTDKPRKPSDAEKPQKPSDKFDKYMDQVKNSALEKLEAVLDQAGMEFPESLQPESPVKPKEAPIDEKKPSKSPKPSDATPTSKSPTKTKDKPKSKPKSPTEISSDEKPLERESRSPVRKTRQPTSKAPQTTAPISSLTKPSAVKPTDVRTASPFRTEDRARGRPCCSNEVPDATKPLVRTSKTPSRVTPGKVSPQKKDRTELPTEDRPNQKVPGQLETQKSLDLKNLEPKTERKPRPADDNVPSYMKPQDRTPRMNEARPRSTSPLKSVKQPGRSPASTSKPERPSRSTSESTSLLPLPSVAEGEVPDIVEILYDWDEETQDFLQQKIRESTSPTKKSPIPKPSQVDTQADVPTAKVISDIDTMIVPSKPVIENGRDTSPEPKRPDDVLEHPSPKTTAPGKLAKDKWPFESTKVTPSSRKDSVPKTVDEEVVTRTRETVVLWLKKEITVEIVMTLIVQKLICIEEIFELTLLEKLVEVSRDYEIRRQVRNQIRTLRSKEIPTTPETSHTRPDEEQKPVDESGPQLVPREIPDQRFSTVAQITVGKKPSEKTPDEKPRDKSPDEKKPKDKTPDEKKPKDKSLGEKKPLEKTPDEKPKDRVPDEKPKDKVPDEKPKDKTPDEKKLRDKKSEETHKKPKESSVVRRKSSDSLTHAKKPHEKLHDILPQEKPHDTRPLEKPQESLLEEKLLERRPSQKKPHEKTESTRPSKASDTPLRRKSSKESPSTDDLPRPQPDDKSIPSEKREDSRPGKLTRAWPPEKPDEAVPHTSSPLESKPEVMSCTPSPLESKPESSKKPRETAPETTKMTPEEGEEPRTWKTRLRPSRSISDDDVAPDQGQSPVTVGRTQSLRDSTRSGDNAHVTRRSVLERIRSFEDGSAMQKPIHRTEVLFTKWSHPASEKPLVSPEPEQPSGPEEATPIERKPSDTQQPEIYQTTKSLTVETQPKKRRVIEKTFRIPRDQDIPAPEEHESPIRKMSDTPKSPTHKTPDAPKSPTHKTSEAPKFPVHKTSDAPKSPVHKTSEAPKFPVHKTSEAPKSRTQRRRETPDSPAQKPTETQDSSPIDSSTHSRKVDDDTVDEDILRRPSRLGRNRPQDETTSKTKTHERQPSQGDIQPTPEKTEEKAGPAKAKVVRRSSSGRVTEKMHLFEKKIEEQERVQHHKEDLHGVDKSSSQKTEKTTTHIHHGKVPEAELHTTVHTSTTHSATLQHPQPTDVTDADLPAEREVTTYLITYPDDDVPETPGGHKFHTTKSSSKSSSYSSSFRFRPRIDEAIPESPRSVDAPEDIPDVPSAVRSHHRVTDISRSDVSEADEIHIILHAADQSRKMDEETLKNLTAGGYLMESYKEEHIATTSATTNRARKPEHDDHDEAQLTPHTFSTTREKRSKTELVGDELRTQTRTQTTRSAQRPGQETPEAETCTETSSTVRKLSHPNQVDKPSSSKTPRITDKDQKDDGWKRPTDMTRPADGMDLGVMDPIGPTDENGRPLFGLKALKAWKPKGQAQPNEDTSSKPSPIRQDEKKKVSQSHGRSVHKTSGKREEVETRTLNGQVEVETRKEVKSFLHDHSEVTGIQDVVDRMKAQPQGEVGSDEEARSLLNKFLGAQVLVQGLDPLMKDLQHLDKTNIKV